MDFYTSLKVHQELVIIDFSQNYLNSLLMISVPILHLKLHSEHKKSKIRDLFSEGLPDTVRGGEVIPR